MSDRWEEEKERLIALRSEYDALFRHFHFMQGLRFATLAATMPILGALFNYYRTALPFTQFKALRLGTAVNVDPYAAVLVVIMGLGVFFAIRSIELGISLQTRVIVKRASVIEIQLKIIEGVFTALQERLNSPVSQRITYIIRVGYIVGFAISILLAIMALWATTK